MSPDEKALRLIAEQARDRLPGLLADPGQAGRIAGLLTDALAKRPGPLAQLALHRALRADPALERWARAEIRTVESRLRAEPGTAPPARYLTTSLPGRSRGAKRLALHAAITLDGGPGSVPVRPFPIPPSGVDVLISVASETLLIENDEVQRVRVRPDTDSETVLFVLAAPAAGRHEVRVRAFLADGGGEVSAMTRTVVVDPAGPTEAPRTLTARMDHLAAAEPGGVTLQIDRSARGLAFRVIGADLPAVSAAAAPPGMIRDILRDAHQMATGRTTFTPGRARRRMADWGITLWDLVPPAVREEVTARLTRPGVTGLTLSTDVGTVPWELLTDPAGDGFLVDRMPLVRQTGTRPAARSLTLADPVFVVGSNPPPAAEDEIRKVYRLLVDPGEPDRAGTQERLVARIDAGDFNLLHLACHQAQPEDGRGGGVQMSDGPFQPVALAKAVRGVALDRRCPLVFFNACRSLDGGSYDTLMGGWADRFLRAGAGAFVGSSWAVRSDTAGVFAVAFYEAFVGGLPLGQASLAARRAVAGDESDPTGLAYAVYGDPAAVVTPGGEW
ncbi:CHAT domain-containing protein [Actinoplanes sp. DH11]|uniref:CHAT domain-containing protein n=1 Tax=Actinoplanes sp. DH11 TaxID=2857011 RepID=UPI001E508546|nr:CHAT domain-containing protein [Actinoplanes sp. DH11]